ncbi:hypothetical protein B5S33_g2002 [[Candida] boidinii]|nr:hypothetical protein B5S30_g2840 [[Candida] boidinii]OWB83373.1 hypothetical protein B5S33_g2002 [[Candida] boidinii]
MDLVTSFELKPLYSNSVPRQKHIIDSKAIKSEYTHIHQSNKKDNAGTNYEHHHHLELICNDGSQWVRYIQDLCINSIDLKIGTEKKFSINTEITNESIDQERSQIIVILDCTYQFGNDTAMPNTGLNSLFNKLKQKYGNDAEFIGINEQNIISDMDINLKIKKLIDDTIVVLDGFENLQSILICLRKLENYIPVKYHNSRIRTIVLSNLSFYYLESLDEQNIKHFRDLNKICDGVSERFGCDVVTFKSFDDAI